MKHLKNYTKFKESVNEESYKVAGKPVTLIKGKKADGTDWKVKFQNGKETPLSDVLSLIKPFPKGIKESVNESNIKVNEGKDDFVARHSGTNITLKKGYKHHSEEELYKLYDKIGKLVKDDLKVKNVTVVFEQVNEAKNTVGLAFKDEDEYKDFKEFVNDENSKIYKDGGWDSRTKSWYIEMKEKELENIYGKIQSGNKNSGWNAIKDDFESVIIS